MMGRRENERTRKRDDETAMCAGYGIRSMPTTSNLDYTASAIPDAAER